MPEMSLVSQQEGRGDREGAEWVTAGYFFPINEPVHEEKKKKSYQMTLFWFQSNFIHLNVISSSPCAHIEIGSMCLIPWQTEL